MSPAIKTVAIAGASGSLGPTVLEKLVEAGFKVRVLRRNGSKSTFPEGMDVVDVDYSSKESLAAALAGQEAVVNAINHPALQQHLALVDAAAAAGVRRIVPSEFGSDLDNPLTRALPPFADKVRVQEYLEEKIKTTPGLSYTLVYNVAFLDWGLAHDFILALSQYKPLLIDGGDLPFSATTLASIGDAVVGILTHLDETKNRSVRVQDLVTTQNRLLALAKQVAPDKPWQEPAVASFDDMIAAADDRLGRGIFDHETFVPYILRAVMSPGYGGKLVKTDNELLGIKGKTEDDVIEMLKTVLLP